MQRFLALCASILLFASGVALQAEAGVPLVVHHQGRLLDDLGEPVDGVVPIQFELFDASADGVSLWVEFHAAVPVSGGLFTVELGSLTPLSSDLFSPPGTGGVEVPRYLEVTVNGTELLPRLRIGSVPYSLGSQRVSGDIETSPGQVSLSGMSGSTTATIRVSQNPVIPGSEIVLVDGGGSTTGTIRAGVDSSGYNFGAVSGAHFSFWASADQCQSTVSNASASKGLATGVSPGTTHITMTDEGQVAASLESSDDTTKLLLSKSGAQTRHEYVVQVNESNLDFRMTSDADGDGLDEQSLHTEVSSALGTTLDLVSDTDEDGVPNSLVQHKAKGSSGGIRLGGMSGSTTGTIRMAASPDSTVDYLDMDDDGDGFSESQVRLRITPTDGEVGVSTDRFASGPRQSVSMDGSFSHARTTHLSDLDRDGIPDVVLVSKTDSSGAVNYLGMDSDDDGVSDASVRSEAGVDYTLDWAWSEDLGGGSRTDALLHTSPDSGSMTIEHDSDGDGVADNSVASLCAPSSASLAIKTKGTGAHATRVFLSGTRSQDDGVVKSFVWRQTEGPMGTLEVDREVSMDIDSTGSGLRISNADGSKGLVSVSSGLSGSTTGTIRMGASPDSADITTGTDTDGDGVAESSIQSKTHPNGSTWTMSGSTTGTIRMATSPDSAESSMDLDSDNDGVSESSIQCKTHPNGGTWTMSGSTTGTIRMAVSNSGPSAALTIGSATTSHFIDVEGGAYCDGTDWVNASDAASKENFSSVDGALLLRQIEELEISRWNYKGQEGVEHIGPTAQDFHAAFGLGSGDRTISTVDPSGIALAAIQELQRQSRDLQKQDSDLRGENAELRAALEALNRKVDALVTAR